VPFKSPPGGNSKCSKGFNCNYTFRTGTQISNSQDAAAAVALRWSDILMPHSLLNLDCRSVEINVLPFQPEDFGNPGTGRDAGFDHELVRVIQSCEHADSLYE
jgi:hypothetical protein